MWHNGNYFSLRQFADDERVKALLRNLHTKTFSRNRRRTKHGKASKIQRRDREGSDKINTCI